MTTPTTHTPHATQAHTPHAQHTSLGCEHTPGPFTATRSAFSAANLAEIHIGTPELTVCVVYSDPQSIRRDEIAANVALLTAAPDLLAALESAHRALVTCNSCHGIGALPSEAERLEIESATLAARAAIARAQS